MKQKLSRREQSAVRGGIGPGPCNTVCWLTNGSQVVLNNNCPNTSSAYNACYAAFGDDLNCARCSCNTRWVC